MIDLELVARCLSKETNQQIQVYKVLMPNAMVLKNCEDDYLSRYI